MASIDVPSQAVMHGDSYGRNLCWSHFEMHLYVLMHFEMHYYGFDVPSQVVMHDDYDGGGFTEACRTSQTLGTSIVISCYS